MIPSRKFAALLIALLAGAAVTAYSIRAQSGGPPPGTAPSASPMNHNLVVLDPAHGGPDAGAALGDQPEKNLTLAMAGRLRVALSAAGFTVITTRDSDISDPMTTDERAEIANRTHAVACLVLHATAAGSGVHVYTSALTPSEPPEDADNEPAFVPIPWEMAQAGSVAQSLRLAGDFNSALAAGNLPATVGKAPLKPLDNLICPAVAIEVSPLAVPGSDTVAATDADYQKRVTDALTAALKSWRTHADPTASAADAAPAQSSAASRAVAAADAAGRAAARKGAQ